MREGIWKHQEENINRYQDKDYSRIMQVSSIMHQPFHSQSQLWVETCRIVLTFESVVEILWYDHSNEKSLAVLSHGTVHFSVFYELRFRIILQFWFWAPLRVQRLILLACVTGPKRGGSGELASARRETPPPPSSRVPHLRLVLYPRSRLRKATSQLPSLSAPVMHA